MERSTIGLGVVLVGMGSGGWLGSGGASATALIPAALGILLIAFGFLAWRSARPLRWRLAAVVVAALGLVGSWGGLVRAGALIRGEIPDRPLAVALQSTVAVLCAVFLTLSLFRAGSRRQPAGRSDTLAPPNRDAA